MVPGHESSQPGAYDLLRSEGMDSDLSLQQFFSRPVKIAEYEWVSSPALFEPFNPWALFFQDKRVSNRLSNYKLLQAKLHVKVVLNGSPFNYGSAIMSYIPFHDYDDTTKDRAAYLVDVVGASQRPHIFIDPCNNSGGEIECPFVHFHNALNIINGDWDEMGVMRLREIVPLKHALGKPAEVSITVFAWATDVRLSVPTQATAYAISPQSDEYSNRSFSTHATALAAFSKNLVTAPIIGPYMRATQIAASAVSAIASMFGYSKPVDLELTHIRPFTTGQLATTNCKDDSRKLSVDAKQELTIDPKAFGLTNTDELEVSYIASRETWLTKFDWSTGDPTSDLLFNIVVDPFLIRNAPGLVTGTEIHMSALAFASLPFTYWRGSLIFRFQIVCSKFHRGRLRIVYDPETCAPNLPATITAEYNTAYNTVIDISETTDFEINVGWAQPTSYRKHFDPTTPDSLMMAEDLPLAYDSTSNDLGNGVLAVYIVNRLVSPDDTINNDIAVNVFVRAGDDFEVAAPTGEHMNRLRFQPQSEELPIHNLPTEAPGSAPLVDTYATDSNLTGPANLIHFGETIRSFRPLLKRYNIHEYDALESVALSTSSAALIRMERPSLPFDPGFTSLPGTVTVSNYAYAYMTLLKYITSAFVGWRGGIRWKLFNMTCCSTASYPTIVSRHTGCAPLNQANTYTAPLRGDDAGDFFDNTNGMDGIVAEFATINPVVSFEVPYYSAHRFCPGRQRTDFSVNGGKDWMPCYKARFTTQEPVTTGTNIVKPIMTMCAAGEDFTVGFFVGAPVFFLETAIPP